MAGNGGKRTHIEQHWTRPAKYSLRTLIELVRNLVFNGISIFPAVKSAILVKIKKELTLTTAEKLGILLTIRNCTIIQEQNRKLKVHYWESLRLLLIVTIFDFKLVLPKKNKRKSQSVCQTSCSGRRKSYNDKLQHLQRIMSCVQRLLG